MRHNNYQGSIFVLVCCTLYTYYCTLYRLIGGVMWCIISGAKRRLVFMDVSLLLTIPLPTVSVLLLTLILRVQYGLWNVPTVLLCTYQYYAPLPPLPGNVGDRVGIWTLLNSNAPPIGLIIQSNPSLVPTDKIGQDIGIWQPGCCYPAALRHISLTPCSNFLRKCVVSIYNTLLYMCNGTSQIPHVWGYF